MNVKEAFKQLDLPEGSDATTIKKKYKSLAKQYHPDVNKDPESENKLKQINEAYKVASSGQSSDPEDRRPAHHNPFRHNPFENFVVPEHLQLQTTISFKDSVLGCKQNLSYKRNIKCSSCNGAGEIKQNNGCDKCGGKGISISRQGNTIFTRTCEKCHGVTPSLPCKTCDEQGFRNSETEVTVTIPGGVTNKGILRLGNMGNFGGSSFMMDQYTDVFLTINVTPEDGLSLIEKDVMSNLDISLLEALTGCSKSVKTIFGNKEVIIPQKSKNKEEVILPKMGVNQSGNQRIILNVSYPDNTETLIKTLSEI